MPLYQLLGGASRDGVMVYGHANGSDIAETLDEVARYIDLGYKAIRAQCGVPGLALDLRRREGQAVLRAGRRRDSPTENVWSTTKYLDHVPKLFEAIRATLRLRASPAARRAPPPHADRGGAPRQDRSSRTGCSGWRTRRRRRTRKRFRLIRQHTVTPIAVGEIFNTICDCQQLIQEQLIDYIRTTVVHAGGITHLRRIAHLAELYQVRTGSHGATDLSPVCMGAALHFDLWVPNFGIQEYMRHTDETDAVFPHAYTFARRLPASRRGAGARRGHRREARRALSVQAERAAGQPARGRHDVELVNAVDWRPTQPLRSRARSAGATKCPDLPPDFSSSRTPSMRMPRSTALHMS